jgi:hypothetical protein
LQKIYKFLSKRESLSYELTCQILALINGKNNFGKREKVLHLDREVSVVLIGDYLIFTRERLRILNSRDAEKTTSNVENVVSSDFDMVVNGHQEKRDIVTSVAGISIKYPKVKRMIKLLFLSTLFYLIKNVSSREFF